MNLAVVPERDGMSKRFLYVRLFAGSLALFLGLVITCCTPPKPRTNDTQPATEQADSRPADVLWRIHAARRQTVYLPMSLPVVSSGTYIQVDMPRGPDGAAWSSSENPVTIFSSRVARGYVTGPVVDQ